MGYNIAGILRCQNDEEVGILFSNLKGKMQVFMRFFGS